MSQDTASATDITRALIENSLQIGQHGIASPAPSPAPEHNLVVLRPLMYVRFNGWWREARICEIRRGHGQLIWVGELFADEPGIMDRIRASEGLIEVDKPILPALSNIVVGDRVRVTYMRNYVSGSIPAL